MNQSLAVYLIAGELLLSLSLTADDVWRKAIVRIRTKLKHNWSLNTIVVATAVITITGWPLLIALNFLRKKAK